MQCLFPERSLPLHNKKPGIDKKMTGELSKKYADTAIVVDSDCSQRNQLRRLIGKEGIRVLDFQSAEEALASMDQVCPPQMIVTGLSMPGIDGFRFCRLLRSPEFGVFNQIPIVLVSEIFSKGDSYHIAADLGAIAFFSSPVDEQLFSDELLAILGKRKARNTLRALVVGEKDTQNEILWKTFEARGYEPALAVTLKEAADAFSKTSFDVAVIDHHLPDGSGDQLLSDFLKAKPDCVCMMMTNAAVPEQTLSWMCQGAAACFQKPLEPASLIVLCERVRKERALLRSLSMVKDRTREFDESEKKFRMIFDSFEDLYYQTDLDGVVTEISPSVYRLSGWKPEEIIGQPVTRVYTAPADRRTLIKAITEKGYLQDYELSLIKKDGTTAKASLAAHVLYDSNGVITGLAGSLRDITDRKQMEDALRESEEKFRTLTESSPTAILLYQNNKWVYANTAAMEITGFSIEEFRAMDFWEIAHPDHRQVIQERGARRQKNQATENRYEFKIISKDGTVKWVNLSGATTLVGGIPAGIISVLDITDRKNIEVALEKSEERFRTILDEMEVGYLEVDLDGNLTFSNEAFLRIFGYSRGDMAVGVGGRTKEEELVKKIYNACGQMYSTGLPMKSFEWDFTTHDGERRTFEFYAAFLRDSHEDLSGFRGVVRDITERRRAEEEREKLLTQLNQAQKMESIGRLAGGVAHDFNNMLGVILGRAEIGMMRAEPGQPLFYDLEEIRRAAERSAALTRQLLAFARKQAVAPKVLNLNDVVGGMLNMLRRLIGEDIDLVWIPGGDVPTLRMDPSQIDQILANLCVNARDAITGVGKVTIETETTVFDQAYCVENVGFVPGSYIQLAVSDNGCGMNKHTLDKLFEPFFTTKGPGKGTGLGLSTVYGIVKQNNGFINVYSEPGHGTTFKIYLPLHKGRSEQIREDMPGLVSCGHETILLVEDEPMILEIARMMLEHLGYTVLAASTPDEAIRLADENKGIHLLITDVVMPGMNGRDLASRLAARFPDLKRLFMSGYTANVIAHHGVLDEGVHFIQKPFLMKDLAAKVRETLSGQG